MLRSRDRLAPTIIVREILQRGEKRDNEVHSLEDRRTGSRRRCGWTLILAALIAAFTMAITASAQAAPNVGFAWGENEHGQLGDGTSIGPETCGPFATPCSVSPVEITNLSGVTAVSGGNRHALALLENGTVMAWGDNRTGELGDGTTTGPETCTAEGGGACSTKPVEVSGLSGVVAVAAGGEQSYALLSNGTAMAWGNGGGFGGSLGNGVKEGQSDVPVAVCAPAPEPCPGSHLSEVAAISTSRDSTLALLKNGKVLAWGSNSFGKLGNGTETSSSVPIEVTLSEPAIGIASGRSRQLHAVAKWHGYGLGL